MGLSGSLPLPAKDPSTPTAPVKAPGDAGQLWSLSHRLPPEHVTVVWGRKGHQDPGQSQGLESALAHLVGPGRGCPSVESQSSVVKRKDTWVGN
jgi:hypothetical protein